VLRVSPALLHTVQITAETRDRSHVSPCEVCGEQCDTLTGFSPSTSVSPVSIIPPMLHIQLHLHVELARTNGKVWEPSKKQCSFGNRGVLDRQVPSLRSGLFYGEINRFQKAWTDRDTGDARSFPFIQVVGGWGKRNVWSGMHVAASVTKSDNDQLQPIEQPSVATSRSTTPVYGSASVLAASTSYDGFMQISYFTSKAQWSLYVPHSGHYMYHQFNIQQLYVQPTQCIYVFCVDLRTNSDYFLIQHWLTVLYNRDGECLLRGTDWVFKCNSGWLSAL